MPKNQQKEENPQHQGNLHDNRSGKNWPCVVTGIIGLHHVKVNMGGQHGFHDVTNGANGTGIITTQEGNSYTVKLPGLNSTLNTFEVTFDQV